MWTLLEYGYDLIYFLFKNIEDLRWQPFLFYMFYLYGKRNGMRLFRNYLEGHFPYLKSEESEWKLWVNKEIEELSGGRFIPKKVYRGAGRLKKSQAKNSTISSTSLPQDTNQGRQYKMKTLVINAGHGGSDSGAIGVSGRYEKDFNLTVALKVETLLKNNPNVTVILSRTTDVFLSLKQIITHANKAKADAFISIHANSYASTSVGTETFYTRSDSKGLADIIHKYALRATGLKDRGVKTEDWYVTKHTTMPACLLEPGFISNPREDKLLFDPAFQDKFAEAIARGACEYFGVSYEVIPVAVPVTPPGTYPVDIIIAVFDKPFLGLLIEGRSWIPAREVLNALGIRWSYALRKIYIGDTAVETKNFSGTSYIKSIDLQTLGVAKVFLDPDAVNTKRVLLFPKEVAINE